MAKVAKRLPLPKAREQEMIFINELLISPGLVKSRKPEVEKFEAWVLAGPTANPQNRTI